MPIQINDINMNLEYYVVKYINFAMTRNTTDLSVSQQYYYYY